MADPQTIECGSPTSPSTLSNGKRKKKDKKSDSKRESRDHMKQDNNSSNKNKKEKKEKRRSASTSSKRNSLNASAHDLNGDIITLPTATPTPTSPQTPAKPPKRHSSTTNDVDKDKDKKRNSTKRESKDRDDSVKIPALNTSASPKLELIVTPFDSPRGGSPLRGGEVQAYVAGDAEVEDYLIRELAIKNWIEDLLGEEPNQEDQRILWDAQGLAAFLHDGIRLCRLMLVMKPGSVPRIFGVNRDSIQLFFHPESEMPSTARSLTFADSAGEGEKDGEMPSSKDKGSWGKKASSKWRIKTRKDSIGENEASSGSITARSEDGERGGEGEGVRGSGSGRGAAGTLKSKGPTEYEMKKNIYFFLKACEEEDIPASLLFRVQDLYDTTNMLRVLECVEAVAARAEKDWEQTEVTLRRKDALLRQFKINLKFTPEQKKRAKGILEHCVPRKRVGGAAVTPTPAERRDSPALQRKAQRSKEQKSKARRSVKFLLGGGKEKKKLKNSSLKEDETNYPTLKLLYGNDRPSQYSDMDKALATKIDTAEKAAVFLNGMTRLQAVSRAQHARHVLRVKMRNDAYRENVAREIFKTEKDYVRSLDILVDKIFLPLKKLVSEKEGMVHFKLLLTDLQIIRGYHRDLLHSLEPRITNWTPNQCLGDIFVMVSQFLKVYNQYVSRYNATLQEVTNARKQIPKVTEFFQDLTKDKDVANEDVNSFMVRPIQRIPRYLLLLKDLVKHTGLTHKDFADLQKASGQISEVATFVEEKAEEAERIGKLFEIQSRLYGEFESLAVPSRRFVKEGSLRVWTTDDRRVRTQSVFLFNDAIVIAHLKKKAGTEQLVFSNMYYLASLSVHDASEPEPKLFDFALKDTSVEVDMIRFYSESQPEIETWKVTCEGVIQELAAKRKEHHERIMSRAQQKAAQVHMMFSAKYATESESPDGTPDTSDEAVSTRAGDRGSAETLASPPQAHPEFRKTWTKSQQDLKAGTNNVEAQDARGKAWQSRLAAHQERMAKLRQEQAKSQTVDLTMLGRTQRSQVTSLPQGSFLLRNHMQEEAKKQQSKPSKKVAHQSFILLEAEEEDDMADLAKVSEREEKGDGQLYMSPDHRGMVGGSMRVKPSPRTSLNSSAPSKSPRGEKDSRKISSSQRTSTKTTVQQPGRLEAMADDDKSAKRRSWSVLMRGGKKKSGTVPDLLVRPNNYSVSSSASNLPTYNASEVPEGASTDRADRATQPRERDRMSRRGSGSGSPSSSPSTSSILTNSPSKERRRRSGLFSTTTTTE